MLKVLFVAITFVVFVEISARRGGFGSRSRSRSSGRTGISWTNGYYSSGGSRYLSSKSYARKTKLLYKNQSPTPIEKYKSPSAQIATQFAAIVGASLLLKRLKQLDVRYLDHVEERKREKINASISSSENSEYNLFPFQPFLLRHNKPINLTNIQKNADKIERKYGLDDLQQEFNTTSNVFKYLLTNLLPQNSEVLIVDNKQSSSENESDEIESSALTVLFKPAVITNIQKSDIHYENMSSSSMSFYYDKFRIFVYYLSMMLLLI